MKQIKEKTLEKCLETYFHLTVKGEECCLFQDRDGNLHKPHHKENGMYVFLQESPKTDGITYVKELHRFCTKIVKYAMETKEVKIEIPEGYEIDKEKSTFEKIVFKKKEDAKPRSWEEHCKNYYGNYYYITADSKIAGLGYNPGHCELSPVYAKNTLPTEELAEAFLAMMQLMSLRQAWIGDWEPDWSKETSHKNPKYCIVSTVSEGFSIEKYYNNLMPVLSFPTKEMATDFMDCFKDLLGAAKPLV